jgi:tripartite-type tricarboxylate transporter receptor subunit TctC
MLWRIRLEGAPLLSVVIAVLVLAGCARAQPAGSVPGDRPADGTTAASAPASGPAAQPAAASGPPGVAAPSAEPAAFNERAVADFYRGKTVRIVIGFGPGGFFDAHARLLARHLGRYIPGNPTVIAENRPGAGSILAANLAYSSDPKDGTVIVSMHHNLVLQQALGAAGIQFDAARFNWLGSAETAFAACMARTEIGVRDVHDLIAGKQVIVTTSAPGTGTYDVPAVLNAALGLNFKLVPGYDSTAKMLLAIESKEADGACLTFSSLLSEASALLDGDNPAARAFLITAPSPSDHPWLKGVPTAMALAKSEEGRLMLSAIDAPSEMANPFAVAPEVSRDRVAALRKAVANAYADPQLLEEARRANISIAAVSGEEVTRIVQRVLSTPPATLATLKEVLK